MASINYSQYMQSLAPAWLRGTFGELWNADHGELVDDWVDRLKQSVKARFAGVCPEDALEYIGSERGLPRGPSETTAAYRLRLLDAWNTWLWAGTPLGILVAIENLYPGIEVHAIPQAGSAFSLNSDTTITPIEDRIVLTTLADFRGEPGWKFDDNSGLPPSQGFWSRFCILFPDSAGLPAGWAAGAVSPPTGVSTPTKAEVNTLIRTVNKWKPAKATFVSIIVVTSGNVYGWPPTLAWGDPGLVWGGTSVIWNGTEYP